ncbi:MAG: PAS domain S-box protein [Bacteroidales bacterium]|nr:PAS domain S-box protein [Bacteroidales bacterium]
MARIRILIIDDEVGEGKILKYMTSISEFFVFKKTSVINGQIIRSFNPSLLVVSDNCFSRKAIMKNLLTERETHRLPMILFSSEAPDNHKTGFYRKHQVSDFIFPTDHPMVVLTRLENLARTINAQKQTGNAARTDGRKNALSEKIRYQILAGTLFEGIVILRNGIVRDVNDTFLKLSDYQKEEVLGSNFKKKYVPKKYHSQFLIKELINSGSPVEIELIRKNGTLIPVETEIKSAMAEGEEMVVVAIRELTERKQAEQEIKRLSLALDQSANTVVITDIDGKIEYVNKAFTKTTGYTSEEVINKNPRIIKSGKMNADFYKKLWKTILSGNKWEGEFLNRKKNGDLFWENANITPVRNQEGKIVRFIAIKEDITLRKLTEQALKMSEEQYRTLVSNVPGTIYRAAYNKNRTIYYISNAVKDLTGYPPEDFTNDLRRKFISIIHPDDLERVLDTIQMGIKNFKQYNIEYRIITKENKVRWVTDKGTAIFDENKKIQWLDGFILDISDRIEVLEEFRKAKNQAELANQSKSEFLANMSHEIRTPLNSILGFTELLENEITNKIYLNYLNSIKSSSKNLLTLINDILDLSKVEAGKMDINFKYFDIRTILRELEQIFFIKIQGKKIGFHLVISEEIPNYIYLDEERLRQIMLNLVGNAIKFTEKGHVTVRITAENVDHHTKKIDKLIIDVEDTGIGIRKEVIKHIFDTFRQVYQQDNKKYEGTGLGLAISKRLVEIMNGAISVTSRPGSGSTFKVEFSDVKFRKEYDKKIVTDFDYKLVDFKNITIVLADDNDINRSYIKEVFSHTKVNLVEATDGQEAVDMTLKWLPDLILMDIKMPVADGYKASKIIKSNPVSHHIPIIALTAFPVDKRDDALKEAGIDTVLLKPVKIDDLYQQMMKFIPFELKSNVATDQTSRLTLDVQSSETHLSREVYEKINNYFKNKWNQFAHKQPIAEVTQFAKELKEFGHQHRITLLQTYGDILLDYTNSFDIENMREHLYKFRDTISYLNRLYINNDKQQASHSDSG